MTPFNSINHPPLVIHCGHSICPVTVDKLFKDGQVECPFCKKVSVYESKSAIPKNYTMLEVISLNQQPAFQFNIQFSNELNAGNPISDLICQIEAENQGISDFVSGLQTRVRRIQDFNKDLVQKLKVFKAKTAIERQEVIKSHFDQVENINNLYMEMGEMKSDLGKIKAREEEMIKSMKYVDLK